MTHTRMLLLLLVQRCKPNGQLRIHENQAAAFVSVGAGTACHAVVGVGRGTQESCQGGSLHTRTNLHPRMHTHASHTC